MICENCGAQIEDELICPYCGSENEERAQEEQNEVLKDIRRRTRIMQVLPERLANYLTKSVTRLAVFGTVMILVLIFIIWLVSGMLTSRSIGGQQKKLERLEEYYQARDYEAMDNYLDKLNDKYASTYRKYFNSVAVNKGVARSLDDVEDLKEEIADGYGTKEYISIRLYYIYGELYDIREIEEDGFRYGEKDAVLEQKQLLLDALQGELCLEEEEIEDGIQRYPDEEETDYEDMAEEILTRVKKR